MFRRFALCTLPLVLLASCSAFEGKTAGWNDQPALKARIDGIVNVAKQLGWAEAFPPAALAKEGEGLGWLTVQAKDGGFTRATVWTDAERQKASAAVPVYHARPAVNERSPLPRAALTWTNAQLAQWLAWEWAADRWGADSPEKAARAAFASYKFAEAVVTQLDGPGSAELAQWREGLRDLQTFQELAADLREQVRGIVSSQKDPKDREDTLKRIEGNWLAQYLAQYPNRFLTNTYRDFGAGGTVDPATLELIGSDFTGWGSWDAGRPWKSAPELWKALEAPRP